jgi:transglutaminase-like putative cysteine protease
MLAAIDRYFAVALYLLVLTGFITLASTGGLGIVTALLVGAALLFRGYQTATGRLFLISEQGTTILTLGYAAFYLVDYMLLSRSFLNATVHLVLFVTVVRLFSAKRDRDYYFLTVISFLMVLAASILTVDSSFLLAFGLFLLTAVATFILMEMRRSAKKAAVQANFAAPELADRRMGLSVAGVSPALVILILLGAAVIFFLLPRISSSYLSAYAPGTDIATGFSDEVQLGRIGQIQQSKSLVMRVKIDGDAQGAFDLKWRGVSLNTFDGKTWSNPHARHLLSNAEGRFVFTQLGGPGGENRWEQTPRRVHYRMLMEPLSTNVFFLASTPLSLEGNYRTIATDAGGGVFNLDAEHALTRYEATSDIVQPSPDELRGTSGFYPPEVLRNDLQLPAVDYRVKRLASQIAGFAPTNYDKAVALENYLRTHFGYTLQLPRTEPRDPIANFLFERKQGHCEYFASAMAVMLRALQIPARVVDGFRTGEFNDLTSQYLIRASDAHSWVEAYFPGYGWISFDPTPEGAPQIRSGLARIMLYLDAMASFWRDWVVNYDSAHQYSLGRQVARNGFEWYQNLHSWARRHYEDMLAAARRTQQAVTQAPGRWSIGGVSITILLLAAANLGRLLRGLRMHRIAARPDRAPTLAATIWYQRMTHALAKRGWPKSPAQTPQEFADSLSDQPVHKVVAEFTRHYERARFGAVPEDARRLPELYEQISAVPR